MAPKPSFRTIGRNGKVRLYGILLGPERFKPLIEITSPLIARILSSLFFVESLISKVFDKQQALLSKWRIRQIVV